MAIKTIKVKCPNCRSDQVAKNGRNQIGKQTYICKNPDCFRRSFTEKYTNRGVLPEVRKQALEMSEYRGPCTTGRILGISRNTVASIRKKGT